MVFYYLATPCKLKWSIELVLWIHKKKGNRIATGLRSGCAKWIITLRFALPTQVTKEGLFLCDVAGIQGRMSKETLCLQCQVSIDSEECIAFHRSWLVNWKASRSLNKENSIDWWRRLFTACRTTPHRDEPQLRDTRRTIQTHMLACQCSWTKIKNMENANWKWGIPVKTTATE